MEVLVGVMIPLGALGEGPSYLLQLFVTPGELELWSCYLYLCLPIHMVDLFSVSLSICPPP